MTPRRTVKPMTKRQGATVKPVRLWAVVDPFGKAWGVSLRSREGAITDFLGLDIRRWDEHRSAGYCVVRRTWTPDKPRKRS